MEGAQTQNDYEDITAENLRGIGMTRSVLLQQGILSATNQKLALRH